MDVIVGNNQFVHSVSITLDYYYQDTPLITNASLTRGVFKKVGYSYIIQAMPTVMQQMELFDFERERVRRRTTFQKTESREAGKGHHAWKNGAASPLPFMLEPVTQ